MRQRSVEALGAGRDSCDRVFDGGLDVGVEACVHGVDEPGAVFEVDVEGALGHCGSGNDHVDADAGEPVLLGQGRAGVKQ